MLERAACATYDQQAVYEIRLQGELDEDWAGWFDDGRRVSEVTVEAALGETIIHGRVSDQCALFSLLVRVRDLGLSLLSVQRVAR
jgi:hypothetical protein